MKKRIGKFASHLVEEGETIGLGTGSTSSEFIRALGRRVREEELEIYGVPTSYETEILAKDEGIKLCYNLKIDKAFDGADEVNPDHHLLKGRGGALFREKIVDYHAREFYVLVEEKKLVGRLGEKFPVSLEVHPLALELAMKKLEGFGKPNLRLSERKPIITDNGNFLVDLKMVVEDAKRTERELNSIPGVLENGIFTRRCKLIIGRRERVEILQKNSKSSL
ncbi:MAG: ribose-5-phosphate isomerase RpiA [Candidatus Methanofastidiosia archaeon]